MENPDDGKRCASGCVSTQPLWLLSTSCNPKPDDTEGPVVFQNISDLPIICQSKHLGE